MITRRAIPAALPGAAALALTLLTPQPPLLAEDGAQLAPVADDTRAAVADIARPAAQSLGGRLLARVRQAIADGGPGRAIAVCRDEAPRLASETAAAQAEQGVTAIGRVGVRVRNPENAGDKVDRAAIRRFLAARHENGQQLAELVVERNANFVYYKAINTQATCLMCHGDPAMLPQPVKQALAANYPEDRATGFAQGELRGLWRVAVDKSTVSPQHGQ